MASFNPVWDATDTFEGSYQKMANDPGNYCPSQGKAGSQLIGTNHGISAIGLAQYNGGKCPTVNEVVNLSESKAKTIAKKQYWDPIQGDKINSQAIAHLIFDFTYGGSSGPLQVRQAINKIKGAGTVSEFKSFSLSDAEIKLVNAIPEKQMFDTLIAIRKNFLVGNTYQAGLTNRLNKLAATYANTVKNTTLTVRKYIIPIILIGTVFSVGLFLIIKNSNKN
jgi:lysozyme family protein